MKKNKEALILASIWYRNRFLIHSKTIKESNNVFSKYKYLFPQYRKWILCGNVPKELRYISGAKIIESNDLVSLRNACMESLNEEEMGASPIQMVYFNATEEVFDEVLNHIDRGWIATCSESIPNVVKKRYEFWDEIDLDNVKIYFLDSLTSDISIENRLIKDSENKSKGVKLFMIQMKQSQIHLAFQAIRNELESKSKVTQSYLAETLGVRKQELNKIIEIGERERRMDISGYIEKPSNDIIKFLKEISELREVSLAAVFKENNLVAYSRFRDIEFLTLNFLQIKDKIEKLSEVAIDLGQEWTLRLHSMNKDIFIYNLNYIYCFILEKGVNFITFRARIKKLAKNVK